MSSITQNTAITSELIRLVPPEKEEKPRTFPNKCALPIQKAKKIIAVAQQLCTAWEVNSSTTEYNSPLFSMRDVPSGFWGTNQGNVIKLIHKHFQQSILAPKTHEKISSDLTRRIQEQSANTGEVMAELIRRSGTAIDKNASTLPLALFQTISQSLQERLYDLIKINNSKSDEFNSFVTQRAQAAIKNYTAYVSELNDLESEKQMDVISRSDREIHDLARNVRATLIENSAMIASCHEAIEDLSTLETSLFQNNRITLYKTEVINDEKSGERFLSTLTSNANKFYALRCIEIDENYKNHRTIGVTIGTDNSVHTPRVGTSFYDTRKSLKNAVKIFFSKCLGINNSIQITVWTKNK